MRPVRGRASTRVASGPRRSAPRYSVTAPPGAAGAREARPPAPGRRRARRDPAPIARITSQALVDQPAPPDRAGHQGEVYAVNGVGAELAREIAVGRVGLRDHEDAARALVEAMDQSGPGAPSIAGLPRLGALTVAD